MEDKIIKKYIKQFILVQITKINYTAKTIEFEYDEAKTALCLGTVIDNIHISLGSNKIYPIFTYSENTELNKYYILKVLDYGTPIPLDDKFLLLEDSDKELRRKYQITRDWYYNEIIKNEKQNIKSFEKERAKLLEK